MTFHLVIKANSPHEAETYAEEHGITANVIGGQENYEVYATSDCSIETLQEWFGEQIGVEPCKGIGFPVGTLLHFSSL